MSMNEEKRLSPELREAIYNAAKTGALEAYGATEGSYVNYFKATETLLYNYKKLAALVADEAAYCEVEYHGGKKTFGATPKQTGYVESKMESEIVEEMQEGRAKQYRETKRGFDQLDRAIRLFKGRKEFVVIRLYYFGEDMNGNEREKPATWEDVSFELETAGVLKEPKTARRWRNKIVNDMSVCIFGIPAAISAATFRKRAIEK